MKGIRANGIVDVTYYLNTFPKDKRFYNCWYTAEQLIEILRRDRCAIQDVEFSYSDSIEDSLVITYKPDRDNLLISIIK